MTKPLGIAILGGGDISRRYIDCLSQLKQFELIGYAAKIQRAVSHEGIQLPQRTIGSLIADPAVDLVLNLLPPMLHAEWSLAALEAGKHVYSEKPIAHDMKHAERLMAAVKSGQLLTCAPATPLGPVQQTLRNMIDAGELGDIVGASGTIVYVGPDLWHHNPAPLFGEAAGPLFDMGVYTVAAFVHWFGSAKRVGAVGRQSNSERRVGAGPRAGEVFPVSTYTHLTGWIEFASGVVANITVSFDSPGTRASAIEVYGRKASVAIEANGDGFNSSMLYCQRYRQWQTIPARLMGWTKPCWAIGLIDTAHAMATHTSPRLSVEIAIHTLDILTGLNMAATNGQVMAIQSRCERSAPLPMGNIEDAYPHTFDKHSSQPTKA
jgi:predicted dehydrogenase